MAYSLRYYNEFTSLHYKRLVRIEIYERDYTGDSEQIQMGASIHLSDSGDGREEPIKKLTASLRLLSERNFQFEHLFTADDKKYKVYIYRNGSPFFRGYLESDSYSEPYYSWKNYTVNLTARDNLGRLEDIPYLDGLGNRIEGLESASDIITRVLLKTGLDLNYYDLIGLWSSDMVQGSIMLPQTYINNDAFWNFDDGEPLSCLEVLTNILSGLGSQLRQLPQGWVIVDQAKYYDRPTVQGNSASFPSYLKDKLNFPEVTKAFRWINRDAEMTILPAWKEFTLEQDYNTSDTIFNIMPFHADFTFISGTDYSIDNWSSRDGYFSHNPDSNDDYIKPKGVSVSEDNWVQTSIPINTATSTNLKFSFSIVLGDRNSQSGLTRKVFVDIINNGSILTESGWVTYTSQEQVLEFDGDVNTGEATDISIFVDNIPNDGGITFKIWYDSSSVISPSMVITDFSVNKQSLRGTISNPKSIEISGEIDTLNNMDDSFNLGVGQAPDVEFSSGIYISGLFDSSGNAQVDWKRSGDTTAKDLLEQVAIGYDLQNRQPARQVNGTVIWDHDVWTNIDDQNRRLMINAVDEWNLNTDEMTAEWVEVFEYKNTLGAFDSGYDDGFDNSDAADYKTDTTFTITEKYE